jgi:hypothetical protein
MESLIEDLAKDKFDLSESKKYIITQTKYIDTENSLTVEISVFNEKYKEVILNEHRSKFNLPFYITWILMFLKVLHYNLGILPIYYYSLIKKTLTNTFYDGNKSEFVVVELT